MNDANGDNKGTQTLHGTCNIAHIQRALGPLANGTDSCGPLNIFSGPRSITPQILRNIQYIEHGTSEDKMPLQTANPSAGLVDLPAGEFTFGTDFDHRDERGSYEPDALAVAGESNGIPSLPTAGRYSNFSSFGSTTNSKPGLRWQVFNELTLRSTVAQDFRAPSINELFGSPARFHATLADPYSVPIADGAAPGVPAG